MFNLGLEMGVGPEVERSGEGKIKGSLETEVKLKDMLYTGRIEVVDGKVVLHELKVPELNGEVNLEAKLQALSAVANIVTDPLFNLPLSMEIPVPLGGVPFTLGLKIGVQVNLSMAMLGNTLSGKAKIAFSGDGGYRFEGGQLNVFGKRVQNADDLLKSVTGLAEGPVGIVFTNELPKVTFGLGYKGVMAGVFLSNGYVTSFHILPMPAPCTAANVSYVLASGLEGKFFGVDVEVGRKAITDKRWHFQVPTDARCNTG